MKHFNTFLVSLAIFGLSISVAWTQNKTYIITAGSFGNYQVTLDGSMIAYTSLQNAIDVIKDDAAGAACTLQFGDGSSVFDLGGGTATRITFTGNWEKITLTGKATTACTVGGIIRLENGIDLNCTAEITSTTSQSTLFCNAGNGTLTISGGKIEATDSNRIAILKNSWGVVNINDGTVQALDENGTAIYNASTNGLININGGTIRTTGTDVSCAIDNTHGTVNINGREITSDKYVAISNHRGTLNISGGKISAINYSAIYNNSAGKITVSCTALITSSEPQGLPWTGRGTIFLRNQGPKTDKRLIITGDTIENTADNGEAIYNESPGYVEINGGKILVKKGKAIRNDGTVTAAISGGICFAYGISDIGVISGTTPPSSDAVIVAWNQAVGNTAYQTGTNIDIYKTPAPAMAIWAYTGGDNGILAANGTNTGFIPIDGITITDVGIVGANNYSPLPKIYPNPTTGAINN